MATGDAATILGLGDKTGRIAPGLDAGVVFLDDPAGSLWTLLDPVLRLLSGRAHDRAALKHRRSAAALKRAAERSGHMATQRR
jgi:cytosine/adenosine deaminase-related metal-dependent hydrolase